jgi:superfamily I DNA and RNA helicase
MLENGDIYIRHTKKSIIFLLKELKETQTFSGITIVTRNEVLLETADEFVNDNRIKEYERRFVDSYSAKAVEVFVEDHLERKEVLNVFFEILKKNLKKIKPES